MCIDKGLSEIKWNTKEDLRIKKANSYKIYKRKHSLRASSKNPKETENLKKKSKRKMKQSSKGAQSQRRFDREKNISKRSLSCQQTPQNNTESYASPNNFSYKNLKTPINFENTNQFLSSTLGNRITPTAKNGKFFICYT